MVGFAPQLQTEVRPVETASPTSTTSGLLSIVSGFLPTKAAPEPKVPSFDDQKKQASNSFYREMEKARQAREQGNTAAASRISNSAFRGYVTNFGTDDADIVSTFEGFSGAPISLALTGSAQDNESIVNSPIYQSTVSLLRAQNPNASEEQVASAALKQTADYNANEQQIAQINQQEKVNWIQAKPVYETKINLIQQQISSVIATIDSDRYKSAEERQQLREVYTQSIKEIQKPIGVSDADWNSFTATTVAPLTKMVEGVIEISGDLTSDQTKAASELFALGASKGFVPPALLTRFNSQTGTDPFADLQNLLKALGEENLTQKQIDFLTAFRTGSIDEVERLVLDFEALTPETFLGAPTSKAAAERQVKVEEFRELNSADKISSITASSTMLSTGRGSPAILAADADDMLSKLNLLDDAALQPQTLDRIFTPNYFAALKKVSEANPAIGKDLMERTADSISNLTVNGRMAIESEARQYGLKFSQGAIVVDENNATAKEAQKFVDQYFGGSWERAKAAKGEVKGELSSKDYEFGPLGLSVTALVEPSGVRGGYAYAKVQKYKDKIEQKLMSFDAVEKKLKSYEAQLPLERPQQAPQITADDFEISYKVPEEVTKDTAFMSKVGVIAQDFGFDPNDLLRVIEFETAGSWSPAIQPITKDGRKLSTATGLIQFLESTAKGLGTSTAELAKMTRAEQMDYVAKYLEPFKGRLKNFGDIYMAVHWPAGVGKGETYVMYEEGSKEYDANKSLDTNGDGTVTRGETIASVISRTGGGKATTPFTGEAQQLLDEAKSDVESVMPPAPQTTSSMAPQAAPTASPEVTEEQPSETPTEQPRATSEAPVVSAEGQALLASIGGEADKTFTSQEEFQAATAAGELEAGDIVSVNGELYFIRRDGSAQKVG